MAIRRRSFWGGWWGGRAGLIDEGFKTVTNKTLDQERDAVDHITECMFSVDFLKSISDAIFEHRSELTVGQFYDTWFKATGSTRKVLIPFNPGVVLALLYVGILFAKENWFDLVPDVELSKSDPAWGLKNAAVTAPTIQNPTLRYTVRRLRNSLGHGTPVFSIPDNIAKAELFKKASFSFHDVNMRNASDTFDLTLTLDQLTMLVKHFQSAIHKHVREKQA
jgi:hypothetical protein